MIEVVEVVWRVAKSLARVLRYATQGFWHMDALVVNALEHGLISERVRARRLGVAPLVRNIKPLQQQLPHGLLNRRQHVDELIFGLKDMRRAPRPRQTYEHTRHLVL